jgi:hypothetical protein
MAMSFDSPPVTGGRLGQRDVLAGPGETFPIGMTAVKCTATDSLNRTASCGFNHGVSSRNCQGALPCVWRQHHCREVTFPVGSSSIGAMAITKQVVVPRRRIRRS